MVACGHLLDEVQRGLDGRYFRERISENERLAIPAMLRALALMVPDRVPAALRDPGRLPSRASEGQRRGGNHHRRPRPPRACRSVPPALSAREACVRVGLLELTRDHRGPFPDSRDVGWSVRPAVIAPTGQHPPVSGQRSTGAAGARSAVSEEGCSRAASPSHIEVKQLRRNAQAARHGR